MQSGQEVVQCGAQYDYFRTSLQTLWAPSQRLGVYDEPAMLKEIASEREAYGGLKPSPSLVTSQLLSAGHPRHGLGRAQSSRSLRRRPLHSQVTEDQPAVHWKSSIVKPPSRPSSISSGALASSASVSPPPVSPRRLSVESKDMVMAGRLGMIHGLWGREKDLDRPPARSPLKCGSFVALMTSGAKVMRPPKRPLESPVTAAKVRMSVLETEYAQKKKQEIEEIAKEQLRKTIMKHDTSRRALDDYGDSRFDLLSSLNALRRKGEEMARVRREQQQEGAENGDAMAGCNGPDESTLLRDILEDTNDDEDALTEIIEELMNAQDAAKQCGGAQHATIHIVNRCVIAARRKRECLFELREGLEVIESKSQWDRDILVFRQLLNSTIHSSSPPTGPKDGLIPEHKLSVRAIEFLSRATDERGKAIIEYGSNSTDSADVCDKMVVDVLKLVKVKLVPSVAGSIDELTKYHPLILQAKKIANDYREGERMKQRKLAADKKQAELRAKQEAELRAKQAANSTGSIKRTSSLFRASVNLVRLSISKRGSVAIEDKPGS